MKRIFKYNNFLLLAFFHFCLVVILLSFNAQFFQKIVFASSKYVTYHYAQILSDDVYLYKTNQDFSLENTYFEIPKSYFVMLLSNIDDDYYKVQYRDLTGFVLKQEVYPVTTTPQTPYLENISFRVYTSDGTNICVTPTSNSKITKTTQTLSSINYYGKIHGDECVSGRSSIWFFGKDTTDNTTGYFYSGYCDNLTTIMPNTETATYTTNPFEDNSNDYLYNLVNLTPTTKIILIICTCLPALIIVFLLFKPFKLEKSKLFKTPQLSKSQNINKIQKVIDEDDTL